MVITCRYPVCLIVRLDGPEIWNRLEQSTLRIEHKISSAWGGYLEQVKDGVQGRNLGTPIGCHVR